jgi:AcrR family transcriptional regulator
VRLLDRGGTAAITMRAVAQEAGTTTPTVYQRFDDRDALIRDVVLRGEQEILAVLARANSVARMIAAFLRFACEHPNRFDLNAETFGTRLVRGDPMPVYELLKSRLQGELAIAGRKREDLALAVVSLALGTARAMIAAGITTRHAKEFHRAGLSALRMLLDAFRKIA